MQAALRGVNEIYSTPYSAPYSRVAAFAEVSKDVAAVDDEKKLLDLPPAKMCGLQNEVISRRLT